MQPENLNPLRSYLNTTTSARCSFENPNWGLHRFLNSLFWMDRMLISGSAEIKLSFANEGHRIDWVSTWKITNPCSLLYFHSISIDTFAYNDILLSSAKQRGLRYQNHRNSIQALFL